MAYTIDKLSDCPVILMTLLPGANEIEVAPALHKTLDLLSEQPGPVFLIYDLTVFSVNLDGMLRAAEIAPRGGRDVLHHPNVRENIFVVPDTLLWLAIRHLAANLAGESRIRRFAMVDDALTYCRAEAASGPAQARSPAA